jgi:hypothetical protein
MFRFFYVSNSQQGKGLPLFCYLRALVYKHKDEY